MENVSSQTDLRICLRAFAEEHPLRPALDVLMRLVDDGMSTRLYHRLCDARGLCYDVSAATTATRTTASSTSRPACSTSAPPS